MTRLAMNFIAFLAVASLLRFEDSPAQVAASHRGPGQWYKNQKGKFKERHFFQKAVKSNGRGHHDVSSVLMRPQVSDMIQAMQHLRRVTPAMTCSVPRQKVVRVSACYPDLNGGDIYPSSTVLYECSEASGCCGRASGGNGGNGLASALVGPIGLHGGDSDEDALICAASEQEVVALYFYVTDGHGSRRVQTLSFLNHSSCSCVARPPGYSQLMYSDEPLCQPQYPSLDEAMGHPRK